MFPLLGHKPALYDLKNWPSLSSVTCLRCDLGPGLESGYGTDTDLFSQCRSNDTCLRILAAILILSSRLRILVLGQTGMLTAFSFNNGNEINYTKNIKADFQSSRLNINILPRTTLYLTPSSYCQSGCQTYRLLATYLTAVEGLQMTVKNRLNIHSFQDTEASRWSPIHGLTLAKHCSTLEIDPCLCSLVTVSSFIKGSRINDVFNYFTWIKGKSNSIIITIKLKRND